MSLFIYFLLFFCSCLSPFSSPPSFLPHPFLLNFYFLPSFTLSSPLFYFVFIFVSSFFFFESVTLFFPPFLSSSPFPVLVLPSFLTLTSPFSHPVLIFTCLSTLFFSSNLSPFFFFPSFFTLSSSFFPSFLHPILTLFYFFIFFRLFPFSNLSPFFPPFFPSSPVSYSFFFLSP